MTGSKYAVNAMNCSGAGGSYTPMRDWVNNLPMTPLPCPSGTVVNVFDNEQVIGRKSGLVPKNTARSSVITNCGVVQLGTEEIQTKAALKPKNWTHIKALNLKVRSAHADDKESMEAERKKFLEIVQGMISQGTTFHHEMEKYHYTQLYFFLEKAIDDVRNAQMMEGQNYVDDVDRIVGSQTTRTQIICAECGAVNE